MSNITRQTEERETFVIRVVNTQKATWQGTITWMDGKKTESFRSALEMIRLMDSALLAGEELAKERPLSDEKKN